jgi:predicted metal-dependent peptidase
MTDQTEIKLKKAHVRLMKHRLTAPYIGAIMLGESSITDDSKNMPTARTNGIDKVYDRKFLDSLTMPAACGAVLHENAHVFLKHIPRHLDLMDDDPHLANACFDYVTNALIQELHVKEPTLIEIPPNSVYDAKFHNWSVREVWNFLKKGQDNQGNNQGEPKEGEDKFGNRTITVGGQKFTIGQYDQHDSTGWTSQAPWDQRKTEKQIDQALQQGAILAGKMGLEIPRAMIDAGEPPVDWRTELMEFVNEHTRGTDEYTFRRYNRHRVADDFYLPSTESEKVGTVIVAGDTSGSIDDQAMGVWKSGIADICTSVNPETVKLLWWDVGVKAEETFHENEYHNIKEAMRPKGGGGTEVSSVARFVRQKKLEADCIIIFTDGYVESDIKWDIAIPTLWLVTQNTSFTPPVGRVVKFQKD